MLFPFSTVYLRLFPLFPPLPRLHTKPPSPSIRFLRTPRSAVLPLCMATDVVVPNLSYLWFRRWPLEGNGLCGSACGIVFFPVHHRGVGVVNKQQPFRIHAVRMPAPTQNTGGRPRSWNVNFGSPGNTTNWGYQVLAQWSQVQGFYSISCIISSKFRI